MPMSGKPTAARRKRGAASAAPKLSLVVQFAAGALDVPSRARLRYWVAAALEREAEVTLRIVDEAEARTLNRDFRGKRRATNVLTFVYHEQDARRLRGDIVLCAPVVAREASAQAKLLAAHYAHLTVHGVLHLQGYDHAGESDAAVMEAREKALLRRFGFPDPYP
jgi:probable rRNA maturation factor